jgi:hypothetical protein
MQELEHHACVLSLSSLRVDVRAGVSLHILERQQTMALPKVTLLGSHQVLVADG